MAKAKWSVRWLMTDERMGQALGPALERLPSGSGVVVRHYGVPDRVAVVEAVAAVAVRRGLVLGVAGDVGLARSVGAAFVHKPDGDPEGMPVSWPVHSLAEADRANAQGAALAFVSPLFATRSHPDGPILSHDEAGVIVTRLTCPAIALGGMNEKRFAALEKLGFHGWAGIDAWIRI